MGEVKSHAARIGQCSSDCGHMHARSGRLLCAHCVGRPPQERVLPPGGGAARLHHGATADLVWFRKRWARARTSTICSPPLRRVRTHPSIDAIARLSWGQARAAFWHFHPDYRPLAGAGGAVLRGPCFYSQDSHHSTYSTQPENARIWSADTDEMGTSLHDLAPVCMLK